MTLPCGRFYLPVNKLSPVFEQPPLAVSYRVGGPQFARGSDWVVEVNVALSGSPLPKLLNVAATFERVLYSVGVSARAVALFSSRILFGGSVQRQQETTD